MAWNMGFKFLQLELDSKVVLTWLTNNNINYPTNRDLTGHGETRLCVPGADVGVV